MLRIDCLWCRAQLGIIILSDDYRVVSPHLVEISLVARNKNRWDGETRLLRRQATCYPSFAPLHPNSTEPKKNEAQTLNTITQIAYREKDKKLTSHVLVFMLFACQCLGKFCWMSVVILYCLKVGQHRSPVCRSPCGKCWETLQKKCQFHTTSHRF